MHVFVALLRAVNVGGTGKLPMKELQLICEQLGFKHVRTYIASGNVVFASKLSEAKIKAAMEKSLAEYAGKPVGVFVRSADDMAAIVTSNPFPRAATNRVVAVFLDEPAPRDAFQHATGKKDEEMKLGTREIYIHYGDGMGTTKLKIPAAKNGTARNMNTVAKLAEMASSLQAEL